MKIGTTNITNCKSGSTQIKKVFSGTNLIWSSVDPDAQAFITAASITDPTQKSAVNQLVVDLKAASLWTKMKAVYPFVGGSASSHAICLKRLTSGTFYGGFTHDSGGAKGNGTNGYFDTGVSGTDTGQYDTHCSIYSRTNSGVGNTMCDIGIWNGSFGSNIYSLQWQGNNSEHRINGTTASLISTNNSLGFYCNSRQSSTTLLYQKNSNIYSGSNTSNNYHATTWKLWRPGEYNGEYSNRYLAFSSIGYGLSNSDMSSLYTAVQTFQTTLGRNV